MYILIPIEVTSSMVAAGTSIAEPAASETAWVSGGTYAIGDLRIRTTTHKVYSCVQASTGRTQLPENDPTYWLEKGPTLRWAPFDYYTNTTASSATSLTYVLTPGYFSAISMYGISGANISVTIKDAPGGTVIYSYSSSLYSDPLNWWEYLFVTPDTKTKLVLHDLPVRPNAELTITITSSDTVSLGMLTIGHLYPLHGDSAGSWGGTQNGVKAEPISYSYVKVNQDGTTSIVRRSSATGLQATIMLGKDEADNAVQLIQQVLDTPVSWISSLSPGYDGLNVFGLGSASLSYESPIHATIQLQVKGMI